MKVNAHSLGLTLGGFAAVVHAAWAILVALGAAQGLLDWIYGLHFLDNPFVVTSFNPTTAIILVIVTAVCGYVFGWLAATLWNWVLKKK